MKIGIVTPAPPGSRSGNRVTALRWARLLRQLGHRVELRSDYGGEPWDVLLALHARRSAPAIQRFSRGPVVVVLTGTDLYEQLATDPVAQRAVARADRLVVLQPLGVQALPASLRDRARVVVQSASAPPRSAVRPDGFEVCVLGHLREVKDPLVALRAAARLGAGSPVRVLHAGAALDPALAAAVRGEHERYRWLGELPRQEALELLGRSRLLVVTSRSEGGANVVSEAIAAGVPVLSSRIDGSMGLLGPDYAGYFDVGDDAALAALLERCASEPAFLASLAARSAALRWQVEPVRERRALHRLLLELVPAPGPDRFELLTPEAARPGESMADAVRAGLGRADRELPCRFFYDEEGSLLFEAICELPEYELCRSEDAILRARTREIAARVPVGATVVELGGGNARKTRRILEALLERGSDLGYMAVDISREALEDAARGLCAEHPRLRVTGVCGEYAAAFPLLEATRPKLVLWLGSNIGNLDRAAAASFLRRVGATLGPGDRLLCGIDLRKPAAVMEPAYDDARGVTAEFNRNLLRRLNRELDADFVPEAFRHQARWHDAEGRIEMRLVSERAQRVTIGALGITLELAAGDAIHTEDSYKYSRDEIATLADAAGLSIEQLWTDERQRFASVLLAPGGRR